MLVHLAVAILLLGGYFLIYYMGKKHSEALAEKDKRITELEWALARLLEKYRELSEAKTAETALRPPAADRLAKDERSYVADQSKQTGRHSRNHRPPVVSPTFDRGTSAPSAAQRGGPQTQPAIDVDAA